MQAYSLYLTAAEEPAGRQRAGAVPGAPVFGGEGPRSQVGSGPRRAIVNHARLPEPGPGPGPQQRPQPG